MTILNLIYSDLATYKLIIIIIHSLATSATGYLHRSLINFVLFSPELNLRTTILNQNLFQRPPFRDRMAVSGDWRMLSCMDNIKDTYKRLVFP